MFTQPFHVVARLRGISVANKLGVQVERMIRRLEWKSEVVHREYIFEQLRFLEVTYAASLKCAVQLMRQCICAQIKIVIVTRFVNTHAPKDDRRMIPVTPNHAADIF